MSNAKVPPLQLNICMKSYHEVKLGIQNWQLVNQVRLGKGKSIPIAHINNNRPAVKFNEKLKYYVIEYSCAGNPNEEGKGQCPFTIRLQASYDGTRLVVARVDDSFVHNHSFVTKPQVDERHLYKDNINSEVESEDENANTNTKCVQNDTHNQLMKKRKQREKVKSFMDAHIEVESPAIELDLDPTPSRPSSKSNKGNKKSKESASKLKKRATTQQRSKKRPKRVAVETPHANDDEDEEEEETWQVSIVNVPTTSKPLLSFHPKQIRMENQAKKRHRKKRKPPQRKTQQSSKRPPVLNIVPNDEEEEEQWQVSIVNVPTTSTTTIPSKANQNGKSSKKPAAKKRKLPQRKTQQASEQLQLLDFKSSTDDEEFHGWDAVELPSTSNGGNVATSNKEKLKLTIRNLPRRTRQPPKRVSDQDRAAADEEDGIWEVVSSAHHNHNGASLNESAETCASNASTVSPQPQLKRRHHRKQSKPTQAKRFRGGVRVDDGWLC